MLKVKMKIFYITYLTLTILAKNGVQSDPISPNNLEKLCYEIANHQKCLAQFEKPAENEWAICTFFITPETLDTDWNEISQRLSQLFLKVEVKNENLMEPQIEPDNHGKIDDLPQVPMPNNEKLPNKPIENKITPSGLLNSLSTLQEKLLNKPEEKVITLSEMLNSPTIPKDMLEKLKMNTKLKELQEKLERLKKERIEKLNSLKNQKLLSVLSKNQSLSTEKATTTPENIQKDVPQLSPIPNEEKTDKTAQNQEKTGEIVQQDGMNQPKQDNVIPDVTKVQNMEENLLGVPKVDLPSLYDPKITNSAPKPENSSTTPNGTEYEAMGTNLDGTDGTNDNLVPNGPILTNPDPKTIELTSLKPNGPKDEVVPHKTAEVPKMEKDSKGTKEEDKVGSKVDAQDQKDPILMEPVPEKPEGKINSVGETQETKESFGTNEQGKVEAPILMKPVPENPKEKPVPKTEVNQDVYSEKDTQVVNQEIGGPKENSYGVLPNLDSSKNDDLQEKLVGIPAVEILDQPGLLDVPKKEETPLKGYGTNLNAIEDEMESIQETSTTGTSNKIEKSDGLLQDPKTDLEPLESNLDLQSTMDKNKNEETHGPLDIKTKILNLGHSNLGKDSILGLPKMVNVPGEHLKVYNEQIKKALEQLKLKAADKKLTHPKPLPTLKKPVLPTLKPLELPKLLEKSKLEHPIINPDLEPLKIKKIHELNPHLGMKQSLNFEKFSKGLPNLKTLLHKIGETPEQINSEILFPKNKNDELGSLDQQNEDNISQNYDNNQNSEFLFSNIKNEEPVSLYQQKDDLNKLGSSLLFPKIKNGAIVSSNQQNGGLNPVGSSILFPKNKNEALAPLNQQYGGVHQQGASILFPKNKNETPVPSYQQNGDLQTENGHVSHKLDDFSENQQDGDNFAVINLPDVLESSNLAPNFKNEEELDQLDEKIEKKNILDLFPYYNHHKDEMNEVEGMKYLFGDYGIWSPK